MRERLLRELIAMEDAGIPDPELYANTAMRVLELERESLGDAEALFVGTDLENPTLP